jgi:hypothetical protein
VNCRHSLLGLAPSDASQTSVDRKQLHAVHVGAIDKLTPNDVHDDLQGVDLAMRNGVNTTDSKPVHTSFGNAPKYL